MRLGICSEYLSYHTVGRLYRGLVEHIDRTAFEVMVFHAPGARPDAFSATLDMFADRTVRLPRDLAAQQAMVAGAELDALFYPDIGMSQATYFLAYSRLAPVQATSWGHPDTTGIDTIDYFVSSALLEPDGADEHYSERLIRLDRLPCFYPPLERPREMPGRAASGLPQRGTLYGCPQSLFKLHPHFDAILAAIARADPDGHIVLVEGQVASWTTLLRARWEKTFPVLNERVVFVPRMPLDRFLALVAHCDVLLDPVHFGSGNSMYEASACGTPTVTWPGRFLRGRVAAGAYRQMGIDDAPVAARPSDYAQIAVELAHGGERLRTMRGRIAQAAAASLFADVSAVREFETFIVAALEAAAAGGTLASGWTPGSTQG